MRETFAELTPEQIAAAEAHAEAAPGFERDLEEEARLRAELDARRSLRDDPEAT